MYSIYLKAIVSRYIYLLTIGEKRGNRNGIYTISITVLMVMASRIERAKPKIEDAFENAPTRIFRTTQLSEILNTHREEWHLPLGFGPKKFAAFLLEPMQLREIEIPAEHYAKVEKRYLWGNPSAYGVAVAMRKNAYLTHESTRGDWRSGQFPARRVKC